MLGLPEADHSAHFQRRELADHRTGACHTAQALLDALEATRAALGAPVWLRSAYRSIETNRAVGGAKDSMHIYGLAADPGTQLSLTFVRRLNIWSGIGVEGQVVVHVDLRHLATGHNPSGARPSRPLIFED